MTDALSALLDDVRPRGALFDRSTLDGPWCLRFDQRPPLGLAVMLDGDGWIRADGGAAVALGEGDVAVVVGPVPFTVSSGPDAPPTTPTNGSDGSGRAPDAWCVPATGPTGSAVLLTGTYDVRGGVCDRVLRGIPPVVVVGSGGMPYPIVDVVTAELARFRPGRQAVLDRLLELLLVTALREWLDRPGSGAPAWYHAQEDPVVGAALQRMHADAARPWTVAELAAASGVSRSAFARRFTDLVGEPPMSYLACWRLCLAADLLVDTDATVGAIARQVGYANAYALSVAFRRVHGLPPGRHRTSARNASQPVAEPPLPDGSSRWSSAHARTGASTS